MLKNTSLEYKILFEEISDPVFIIQDGVIKDCNQAVLSILNYNSKMDIGNLKFWELSPDYQPDGLLSSKKGAIMLHRAMEKGYHEFDWVHVIIDGEEVWFNVKFKKITTTNKVIIHALCHDITKRKNAEKALEKAIEEKNKFISVLTHDLRGSVGGSLPLIELLELNGKSWERREEIISHIFININKSFELLDNLVAWGRISQNNELPIMTEFNLCKLFDEVKEQNKIQFLHNEISFMNLCQKEQMIIADKNMMEIVIRNLFGIAVKNSKSGSTINCSCITKSNTIEIGITDLGIEIPQSELNDFFNERAFLEQDLSLQIIKEYVVRQCGTIFLKKKDGKSDFILALPSICQMMAIF